MAANPPIRAANADQYRRNALAENANNTGAPTAVETAYVTQQQQRMLAAFEGRNYTKLAEELLNAEILSAPNLKASRIYNEASLDKWRNQGHTEASFLLLQVHHEVLESVLNNTLPQRARHRNLQPGDLVGKIRRPGEEVIAGFDPIIYVNYCTDKNGKGIPTHKYCHFLRTMEVAVRLRRDENGEYAVNGATVPQGINENFGMITTHSDFLGKIGTDLPELQGKVRDFVDKNENTVLPAAEQQGVSHILLRGEVGLAIRGYDRCEQHRNMSSSSPDIFMLTQLVLRFMFPDHGFRLDQYVLFELTHARQAEAGESIGSQLCSSYAWYGGVNFAQAGQSQTEMRRISNTDWDAIREYACSPTHERFKYWMGNHEAHMELLRRNLREIQEQGRELDARAERARLVEEHRLEAAKLERALQNMAPKLAGLRRGLDRLRELDVEAERAIRQKLEILADLDHLATALGLPSVVPEDMLSSLPLR